MSLALAPLRQAGAKLAVSCQLRRTAGRLVYASIPRASYSDSTEAYAAPRASRQIVRKIPSPPVKESTTTEKPLVRMLTTPDAPSIRSFVISSIESATVGDFGKVVVTTPNQQLVHIDSIRLRDACTCPKCVDQSSRQREFRMSDIPSDIAARTVEVQDGQLVVTWSNDIPGYDESHVSTFSPEQLSTLTAVEKFFRAKEGRRTSWNKSIMDQSQHWVSFKDYMEDDLQFFLAMRTLKHLGLIFVKDIPESPEMVEKIATRMGPLRNSFYGSTWDVRSVPDAKNVAYTNKHLDFHMDLLYMKEPPGYQLLHCLRNSFSGGESLFSDTFQAAVRLLRNDPILFDILCKTPTRFEYRNNNQHYQYSHPTIEIEGGEEFLKNPPKKNPVPYVNYVNYSPPFQAPSYLTKHLVDGRDIKLYVRAMKAFAAELGKPENIFQVKLEPGQCVIFQNRRVVHARNAFDLSETGHGDSGGERWLRGAYVDEDALRSTFRLLSERDYFSWINHPTRKLVEDMHSRNVQAATEDANGVKDQNQGDQRAGIQGLASLLP
ncbi:gamma-butyrobetaine dioxygenase [Histoplasma ohiense]|nr:gamma-butyrobetaine dioxygenase [Histoplasma ohiense (nom. inval.)]